MVFISTNKVYCEQRYMHLNLENKNRHHFPTNPIKNLYFFYYENKSKETATPMGISF